MTLRAWLILAVGLALVAATAAGSVFLGRGSAAPHPTPWTATTSYPWQSLLSPAQSRTVRSVLAQRRLEPASARIVGDAPSVEHSTGPFLLVEATSTSGRRCFVPVLGVLVGPTTCSLHAPVVVFVVRDHFRVAPSPAQTNWSMLGVAGHGVVRVSIGDRVGACPILTNTSVGGVLTFSGEALRGVGVLRAYDERGRVIMHADVPGRSSVPAGQIGVLHPRLSRVQKARLGCKGMMP